MKRTRRVNNKLQNIFLEVEYLGTNYFGFQIQEKEGRNEITVQARIEEALKRLFKQKIRITYAGRTDRGVHAKAQVVNFKINTKIPFKNIKAALNSFLPSDVRVKKVKPVPLDFHARFSAVSKIYRYTILNKREPSVFLKDFSWHIAKPLNLVRMEAVSKKMTGKKDFALFAKDARQYKSCLRSMKDISLKKRGNLVYISLEAEGFLRNMARNIVAFLVKVGLNKITLKAAGKILKGRCLYNNKPAPACGLCLYQVKYETVTSPAINRALEL